MVKTMNAHHTALVGLRKKMQEYWTRWKVKEVWRERERESQVWWYAEIFSNEIRKSLNFESLCMRVRVRVLASVRAKNFSVQQCRSAIITVNVVIVRLKFGCVSFIVLRLDIISNIRVNRITQIMCVCVDGRMLHSFRWIWTVPFSLILFFIFFHSKRGKNNKRNARRSFASEWTHHTFFQQYRQFILVVCGMYMCVLFRPFECSPDTSFFFISFREPKDALDAYFEYVDCRCGLSLSFPLLHVCMCLCACAYVLWLTILIFFTRVGVCVDLNLLAPRVWCSTG